MLLILMVIMKMKMMILMVIEIMTTAPSVLHQLKFGWKCFKLLRRSPLSAQRVHFNGYVNTDRVVMKSCILRLEALSLESILPLKLLLQLITNKKKFSNSISQPHGDTKLIFKQKNGKGWFDCLQYICIVSGYREYTFGMMIWPIICIISNYNLASSPPKVPGGVKRNIFS